MIRDLLFAIGQSWAFYLLVFGVLTAFEIFWKREDMTIRERTKGFVFWFFIIPVQIIAGSIMGRWLYSIGFKPLVDVQLDFGVSVLASVAAVFTVDFWFYWQHRIQHRFFWRWHSVHHSIEKMTGVNSYHHWIEPLFTVTFVMLPLTALRVDYGAQAAVLGLFFGAQPYFIHSNTRLHFGPLQYVLLDNRFHRIHHSLEQRHFDKNFGAITPLWDVLFGTAYWPAKDEWPAVGLADVREPRTLREWSGMPFRTGAAQDAGLPYSQSPPAAS